MPIFRSIVFCSALVGLIVGVLVSVAQQFGTVPLILQAEVYETAAAASTPTATHSHGAMVHEHGDAAWEPADGLERNAFTVVINIATSIGFALMLTGLFVLRGRPVGWREGLLWGLCGFLAVTVAPGLGLSPELPGVQAAPVFERQVWWIGTALATATGLALLALRSSPWAAALALVLFIVPHVIGAPQLEGQHSHVPEALSRRFVVAVTLTSLLSWALLGWLSAVFYRRFDERASRFATETP
jgi:cobalt transporter subunit CbtA